MPGPPGPGILWRLTGSSPGSGGVLGVGTRLGRWHRPAGEPEPTGDEHDDPEHHQADQQERQPDDDQPDACREDALTQLHELRQRLIDDGRRIPGALDLVTATTGIDQPTVSVP